LHLGSATLPICDIFLKFALNLCSFSDERMFGRGVRLTALGGLASAAAFVHTSSNSNSNNSNSTRNVAQSNSYFSSSLSDAATQQYAHLHVDHGDCSGTGTKTILKLPHFEHIPRIVAFRKPIKVH
jgi:hypothetical protein